MAQNSSPIRSSYEKKRSNSEKNNKIIDILNVTCNCVKMQMHVCWGFFSSFFFFFFFGGGGGVRVCVCVKINPGKHKIKHKVRTSVLKSSHITTLITK